MVYNNNDIELSIKINLNNLDFEEFQQIKGLFEVNIVEGIDNRLKFKDIDRLLNLSNKRYQTTSIEYPEQKSYDPNRIQTRVTKIEIVG